MNANAGADILEDVARYYTDRIQKHGLTPLGVDWNSSEGQLARFHQLTQLVDDRTDEFSLIDLGCGYGALVDYLASRWTGFQYVGCDVSREMIEAATAKHASDPRATFHQGATPPTDADFVVASGIFNVRMQHSDESWLKYIEDTLDLMHRSSRKGFAFNCLTSYSDEDRKRSDLFYADPLKLFDYCYRNFSRNVALLHDYGMYEFTLIVRK